MFGPFALCVSLLRGDIRHTHTLTYFKDDTLQSTKMIGYKVYNKLHFSFKFAVCFDKFTVFDDILKKL